MPLDYFIIYIYCLVDNILNEISQNISIMKNGRENKLSLKDSEVITMEIVGEYLGIKYEKHIWEYFTRHWKHFFPKIGCRTSFTRQCANLWKIKQLMQERLVSILQPFDDLFMFDGFPIPVCHIKRAFQSNPFKHIGAVGYCAAKDEKYFGFKGHLLINSRGIIQNFTIAPANIDERDVLPEIIGNTKGLLIADKGLIRPSLKKELNEICVNLQTPLRSNMRDDRSKIFVKTITATRRLVETVIGQLVDRFNIQSIRTKDLWHLSSKIGRKLLTHTMCIFVANFINPLAELQFEKIVL